MGQIKFNITSLTNGVTDAWYPIEPQKPGDPISGELHIIFEILTDAPPVSLSPTPQLWVTLKKGDVEALEKVLNDPKTDVNILSKHNETPLHIAVQKSKWDEGSIKILLMLLSHKDTNVNIENRDKNTAFHYFCQKFSYHSVLGPFNRFLEKGALVNCRNAHGETPIHKSIFNPSLKLGILDLLIARGADINAQSKTGETPLHYAVRLGRDEMVKFLILKGADLTIKSEEGKTAYEVAVDDDLIVIAERIKDSEEIIEWLKKNNLSKYSEDFLANDLFVYILPDLTEEMLLKVLPDDANREEVLDAISRTITESGSNTPESKRRKEKYLNQLVIRKKESFLRKSLHETAKKRLVAKSQSTDASKKSSKRTLRSEASVLNFDPTIPFSYEFNWEIDPRDLEFTSSLGQGASGEVFAGFYKGKDVAIKVLKSTNEDKEIEEFKKEFRVLVSIVSPYIIKFIGACLADKLCMVMEFCSRGSLYDVLRKPEFVMTWDHFFKFAIDTASGLAVLHKTEQGILHRDMKTLNLLVDENYNCKLCDFGLSRFNTGSNVATLSKCRGTYAYIAPEVYNCEKFTTKSDIYSVAIILWEMVHRLIMGKYLRPFQEFNNIKFDFQILIQACKMKLRPTLPAKTPPPIAEVIKKCWHEDRNVRLEAADLTSCLKAIKLEYESNRAKWENCIESSP